jgi:hypothetical protein
VAELFEQTVGQFGRGLSLFPILPHAVSIPCLISRKPGIQQTFVTVLIPRIADSDAGVSEK